MKIVVKDTTYYTREVAKVAGKLDSNRWELGDLLLAAFRDLGEDEYVSVVESSGLSLSACSQARWVAASFGAADRGYGFSWSVYRALASLPAGKRTALCVALDESDKAVTVQEAELLADLARTMTEEELGDAVGSLEEGASPAAIETALSLMSDPVPEPGSWTRIDYVLGRIAERFPYAKGQRWQTVLRAALEIALEWEERKDEAPKPVEWFA